MGGEGKLECRHWGDEEGDGKEKGGEATGLEWSSLQS